MKYTVYMPFTGSLAIGGVEADTAEDAIEYAHEYMDNLRLVAKGDDDLDHESVEVFEWEPVEHVTQGNVFHGVMNDADAQEEDGEE